MTVPSAAIELSSFCELAALRSAKLAYPKKGTRFIVLSAVSEVSDMARLLPRRPM